MDWRRVKMVSGGCHSFYFMCSEILLYWPQNWSWVTFSCWYIFIWELRSGLHFLLTCFIQKGGDWDRELFAGTWVCLWDQAQNHSCDSTEGLWCTVWSFSAEWCCAAVHARFLLYLYEIVTYLSISVEQFFLQNYRNDPRNGCGFFYFLFFLAVANSCGLEK